MATRTGNGVGVARIAGTLLVGALLLGAALALAPSGLAGTTVDPMAGLWRLDSSTGGAYDMTANAALGGAPGQLFNGAAIVGGDSRGTVLQTDGTNDYVTAGAIRSLATVGDDFTWTFWAKQQPGQDVNTDVILGNRFGAAGQWVKFTPNAFEYSPGGTIDYPNIASDDVWHHHAVVKSGSTLTYYRDGVAPQSSVAAALQTIPFFLGGDSGGEQWQGRLDDVALYRRALSQAQVQAVMGGNFTPYQAPSPGYVALSDTFGGSAVSAAVWSVIEKGLEGTGPGTYTATVAGGLLTLGGTATTQYWRGITLRSRQGFDSDFATTFAVDRISLAGSGSAYRSSIWLWGDDSNYLHFSQNIGENGWQYNYRDGGVGPGTGGGVDIGVLNPIDGDAGAHAMMLRYLPTGATAATIEIYLDGQLVASQNFTNWDVSRFYAMITGQGRAIGDTVSAIFDNALVLATPEPGTLALFGLGVAALARRRKKS